MCMQSNTALLEAPHTIGLGMRLQAAEISPWQQPCLPSSGVKMEFLIAGCLLIFSSAVYHMTNCLDKEKSDNFENKIKFEVVGTIFLGVFLGIVGIVGLIAGFYPVKLNFKSALVLSFLLFSLEMQVRLLIIKMACDVRSETFHKSSGVFFVLKKFYSIGFFPKKGKMSFVVFICQILQILIWGFFLIT